VENVEPDKPQPFSPLGVDLFGDPIRQDVGPLAQRFIMPPFSVLDARQGEWQERKRAWISLGIKSELGRGGALPGDVTPTGAPQPERERERERESRILQEPGQARRLSPGGSPRPACDYSKRQREDGTGRPIA
jgi:hypothetical protein